MKKLKKVCIVLSGLVLILAVFIITTINILNRYSIKRIEVNEKEVKFDIPKNIKTNNKLKWNEINALSSCETKVKDIDIYFDNRKINLDIYEKNLRYYVNISLYLKQIGGRVKKEKDGYVIDYNGKVVTLNKKEKRYYKKDESLSFRGELLSINNAEYISINDLEVIMDLRSTWDIENKRIYMYADKKCISKNIINEKGKAAFIRLEDVCSGGYFASSESKEKMKILGDNLYSKGIRFHIAWIPRYINPKKSIDNNLLVNKSLNNVQFINMLDYLIQKGGVVGLHGYTHQYGDSISAEGFELTKKQNCYEKDTRRVVENGIKTAKTLNIPIGFFESPHYGATYSQQKIIGEYFNILYEKHANFFIFNPMYDLNKKGTLYVPTPYGYVKDEYGDKMVSKIKKGKGLFLMSFFIHPYKETKFITLCKIDEHGYRDYNYKKRSPMNNILEELNKRGYKTTYVTELKKN